MRKLILALAAFVITSAIGCSNLTPQQRQQIKTANANAQVAAAKVAAQAKVNDAKGIASPITNPIKYANAVVKKAEKPLAKIALFSFLGLCASVGLLFTSLSYVSKFALPLSLTTLILSGFGIITLPLWPIAALVVFGVLCLAAAYEVYKYRSKVESAVEGVITSAEAEVGLGSTPVPTPAPTKPAPAPGPYVRPM